MNRLRQQTKPTNPGQLFYDDLVDLEPYTKLTLHGMGPKPKDVLFLSVSLKIYRGEPLRSMVYQCACGAGSHPHEHNCYVWQFGAEPEPGEKESWIKKAWVSPTQQEA